MRETIKEKKEIEVDVTYQICDVCEAKVPMDHPIIKVVVDVTRETQTSNSVATIDVCSTECLAKNVGTIRLLIETKYIGKARTEAAKKDDREGLYKAFFDKAIPSPPFDKVRKIDDYRITYTTATNSTTSNMPLGTFITDTSGYMGYIK